MADVKITEVAMASDITNLYVNDNGTFRQATKDQVIEMMKSELPYPEFGDMSTDTITWDGNTSGLTCVSNVFYHVSDCVPMDISQGMIVTICAIDGSEAETTRVTTDNCLLGEYVAFIGEFVVLVSMDGVVYESDDGSVTYTFPKAGVYFVNSPELGFYIKSFTVIGDKFATEKKKLGASWLEPFNVSGSSASGDTITWDGNTDGLYVIDMGEAQTCRIYDGEQDYIDYLSNGFTIVLSVSTGEVLEKIVVPPELVNDMIMNEGSIILIAEGSVIIATADFEMEGFLFKKGIYSPYAFMGTGYAFVSSITINGYDGFIGGSKLDHKYLDIIEESVTNMGDTLVWDGKIDGHYYVEVDSTFHLGYVHISDNVPTIDDITNANGITCVEETDPPTSVQLVMTDASVSSNNPLDIDIEEDTGVIYLGFLSYLVVPSDNFSSGGVTFNKKGIYIVSDTIDGRGYVSKLTIPGYNFGEKIEKIKPEYLPDPTYFNVAKISQDSDLEGLFKYNSDTSVVPGNMVTKSEVVEAFTKGNVIMEINDGVYVTRIRPTHMIIHGNFARLCVHNGERLVECTSKSDSGELPV